MKFIKILFTITLGILIIGGLILFYATKIEPFRLKTNIYDVNEEHKTSEDTLRVVQISDLEISQNYTEKELDNLVAKINGLSPDIIVFTGDLFHNYAQYRPVDEVTEALADLEAFYGKFAIWGNRDKGGGASTQYESILDNAGFILLQNSGINMMTEQGNKVFIGGLDDALLGNPDIDRTLGMIEDESSYNIMLLHEPDQVDEFGNVPMDLMLAGHSHGGQIRVPFMEIVTTSMAENYIKGFYELNDNSALLYVNSGIGTSRMPVRFMAPPEIAVFNIAIG